MSTKLINQTHVRAKTLAVLAERRPHLAAKFTRISGDYFLKMEAVLSNAIVHYIDTMPSNGKTIQ